MFRQRRIPVSCWLPLILTTALLSAGCARSNPPQMTETPTLPDQGLIVRGVVLDRIDGLGMEGVDIYLSLEGREEQLVATSDAEGSFRSEALSIDMGDVIELRAHGSAVSFYPQIVKARMEQAADLWELEFVQAWPVSMWARVARRVAQEPGQAGVHMARNLLHPASGAGVTMPEVPLYYQIEGGTKALLGLTNSNGELFPEPVWLPVGAELTMWPEVEGYRFSPPDCHWLQEPPLESIGALFIADPQDQPGSSVIYDCDRTP